MMKKTLSVAVVALMIVSLLMLAGCGGGSSTADLSDSKYLGDWKCMSMEFMDESEGMEDAEWIITFNDDGTGISKEPEEGETTFTWEPTSDGLKTNGDLKLTFKDSGDNISTKVIGVELIFEKQ